MGDVLHPVLSRWAGWSDAEVAIALDALSARTYAGIQAAAAADAALRVAVAENMRIHLSLELSAGVELADRGFGAYPGPNATEVEEIARALAHGAATPRAER